MARLLLVRHGKTEGEENRYYGHIDIGLSPKGVRQAEALRDRLASEDIAAVYSSDLKRALDTAEVIASAHKLPVIPCSDLRELDFGELAAMTFEEIKERYQGAVELLSGQDPDMSAPGGESLSEMSARIHRFIAQLEKHPPGETVLIVAHDGSLRVLLSLLLGVSLQRSWQFRLDPASLSIAGTYSQGTVLLLLNDSSHLGKSRGAKAEKECIFILGGARSGKSRFAQKLAAQMSERVLFVATGAALDEEMRLRIEEHRKNRPQNWRTVEVTADVGRKLSEEIGDAQVVVLDCLTLLISNIIGECLGSAPDEVDDVLVETEVSAEIQSIIECFDDHPASFIIVSNEVGMGLVPTNRLGRLYRDLLGRANQLFAERAARVYFMLSGLPISLKTGPESEG